MLREITAVRQDTPELRRRWFEDDYFDLFVWLTPGGEITAFQLAYDKTRQERVLAWDGTGGYLHRSVDSGEDEGFQSMTPLLTTAAHFSGAEVIAQFDARSHTLDEPIRRFVRCRLKRYSPRAGSAGPTGR